MRPRSRLWYAVDFFWCCRPLRSTRRRRFHSMFASFETSALSTVFVRVFRGDGDRFAGQRPALMGRRWWVGVGVSKKEGATKWLVVEWARQDRRETTHDGSRASFLDVPWTPTLASPDPCFERIQSCPHPCAEGRGICSRIFVYWKRLVLASEETRRCFLSPHPSVEGRGS
jgi:hypothetical protein